MIILDKPYVSALLSSSLQQLGIPVLKVGDVQIPEEEKLALLREALFFEQLEETSAPLLFNSENGLTTLMRYLPESKFAEWTSLFKNKAEFRRRMTTVYPSFYFQEVSILDLYGIPLETIPFPIIIKPAIGYSSVGVYRIDCMEDWYHTVEKLKADISDSASAYPKDVIDSQTVIVEELIQGEEYAVDAYFTKEGKPVILNLFKRMFANDRDMSDRIYYTSKQVLKETLAPIADFLEKLGEIDSLASFPLHFEVRITQEGQVVPIEVNPFRFAGIGTTELGVHAYGVNVYDYYFNQLEPNWVEKIEAMDNAIYSFLCAEFDPAISLETIQSVDHESFQQQFNEILDYRYMDYKEYPIFSVVFFKQSTFDENNRLLTLDLSKFISSFEPQLV
ncbi:ATP-grasp domain-containing protein [Sporosarcina sp. YIM B06819]|uniref:ATP-grasp domain-containing protein n=1 Tax=Sporosarcina sp. YIM B06819 TaxID=3081769 RepID=UPI00298C6A8F|nr:ATP-grasp domain-containing protein [Sporosarcina sp. YIM B06819]